MKTELENLIKATLQDGVVTAKEREMIHKKAIALGEDPDEIDIYVDAELQKIEQANDAAVRKAKSKTCPYCGEAIQQLSEKCPSCGQIITAAADKELVEILENLEDALVNLKSGKDFATSKAVVERYSRKAKLYYSNNPKIKTLLSEIETEVVKAEKDAQKSAKNAKVNNIFKYFFVTNKKIGWTIVIVIVICIIGLIETLNTSSKQSEGEDIMEAITSGKLTEATTILNSYADEYGYGPAEKYAIKIIKEYIKDGDIESAATIASSYDNKTFYPETNKLMYETYMEREEWDKAESHLDSWGNPDVYFDYMIKVITKLRNEGKKADALDFIDQKIGFFGPSLSHEEQWQTEAVRARLMKTLNRE